MKFLINILKGGLLGIAAVIPGFSGGSIACIIGCYDELLESISGIRKHFKKSVLTLLPYGIGIVLFALASIMPITWGINNYPLVTVSLFAGLLIGGLPSFYKNIQGKANPKNLLSAIICGAIALAVVIPSLFIGGNSYISLLNAPWWMYIVLLLIGILGAAALVIPGISGSMILLIIGFYNPIMDTIKGFIASFLSLMNINIELDFASLIVANAVGIDFILPSMGLIICFGLGIIIGFYLISKLMKYLLQKFPDLTYFGIFGFILASLVGIYTEPSYYQSLDPIQIILAIVFLIVGFIASFMISKLADTKSQIEKKE